MPSLRKGYLLLPLLIGAFPALAQVAPTVFWVQFTDKASTPYTLAAPQEFLSERSLARRTAQNIPLDELDLPVDPAYIATVLAQGDIQLVNRSKWFNAITIRTEDTEALAAVADLSFVQAVRSTRLLHGGDAPDKFRMPLAGGERGGDYDDYGPSYFQISQMNGQVLHAMEAKGQGMLIGVLDSGFDRTDVLPAFASVRDREGIVLTRDLVTHDGDVYLDNWHGRSVLSCLAGYLEGQLQGSAPAADYVLLRTEDTGSEFLVEEDNWIAGAELCDSLGCDVLNTSLGYALFDDSLQNHTYADMDGATTRISIAAGIASRKGMIPVCSAGNQGETEWHYITAPADAIDILAVGAVGDAGNSAPFSSHGPSADGRVKPDVCAMGWGTVGLRAEGDSIASLNGTSFAAPVLAGLVACLWQLHPERTAQDIMHAVRQSASHWTMPDADYGYGIPNFLMAHEWLTMTTAVPEVARTEQLVAYFLSTGQLVIRLPGDLDGPVTLALYDPAGRALWTGASPAGGGTPRVLDLGSAGLAPGAYVVHVQSGERRMARTVALIR